MYPNLSVPLAVEFHKYSEKSFVLLLSEFLVFMISFFFLFFAVYFKKGLSYFPFVTPGL